MVEGAAASGFNTLLVQVRGRGDAVYRSAIEPRAEFLRDIPDSMLSNWRWRQRTIAAWQYTPG